MDQERAARLEAVLHEVRTALDASSGHGDLQQFLADRGVHGFNAVLVTQQALGVSHREAQIAYYSSPVRAADRALQNAFVDAIDLLGETVNRQKQICADHQAPWTPPEDGSIVGVARDVGTGLWPINGLRHPIEGTTCGWYLWTGEGAMDKSPDYFQPVHVEHLYDRCSEVLPYLGLPPAWRFLIAPGYSDAWDDTSLLDV